MSQSGFVATLATYGRLWIQPDVHAAASSCLTYGLFEPLKSHSDVDDSFVPTTRSEEECGEDESQADRG